MVVKSVDPHNSWFTKKIQNVVYQAYFTAENSQNVALNFEKISYLNQELFKIEL
jgi:hypothetical protein